MPQVKSRHIIYTVRPGDTLYSIARRFESDVEAIERANALYPPFTDPSLIFPNQVLVVPTKRTPPFHTLYVVNRNDTVWMLAQRFQTSVDLIAGVNRLADPDFIQLDQQLWVPAFVYEVVEGDSLFRIAQRSGVSTNQIIQANLNRPGFSPDLIYAGYRLLIPLPSSRNIVVTSPVPGQTVQSGLLAEGFARAFEANVLMQIIDDAGTIVSAERFATALNGAPVYGYFSNVLPFDQPPVQETGRLWVYVRSAKDGSIQDLVEVKVRFTHNNLTSTASL